MTLVRRVFSLVILAAGMRSLCIADEWLLPKETTFYSPNGKFAVKISPKQLTSQLDYFRDKVEGRNDAGGVKGLPGNSPHADVFRVNTNHQLLRVSHFLLVNEVAPVTALISNDGRWLVTFDNWHAMGEGSDVVVIYRSDGTVIRSFSLENLLTPEDLEVLPRSASSRYWSVGNRIDEAGGQLVLNITRCHVAPQCHDTPSPLAVRLSDGAPVEPKRHLLPHPVGEAKVEFNEFALASCTPTVDRVDPQPRSSLLLDYPVVAMKARMEGGVGLTGRILVDGTVDSVEVARGVNPLLDASAVHGVRALAFAPARCGGQVMEARFSAVVRYSIR